MAYNYDDVSSVITAVFDQHNTIAIMASHRLAELPKTEKSVATLRAAQFRDYVYHSAVRDRRAIEVHGLASRYDSVPRRKGCSDNGHPSVRPARARMPDSWSSEIGSPPKRPTARWRHPASRLRAFFTAP